MQLYSYTADNVPLHVLLQHECALRNTEYAEYVVLCLFNRSDNLPGRILDIM